MVFHTGRWYVVGHDHLRDSLRTFRIDRVASVTPRTHRFTAPDGFDPVVHVTSALAGPDPPASSCAHGRSGWTAWPANSRPWNDPSP
ncbi:WYL domain-containing protein [Streptomyces sp. NPDC042638]|uniref:helix-turn-helix transcriptional regulator n=1 Tax=Streptomyces sp. NPDC042638 TaxID=3154333 RepID=UPI0033DA4029